MNARSALRVRARRITVAVLVLLLLGTATAAAYWTATAQVSSTTQAASVGLSQQLRPGGQNASLAGPYTPQSPSRAGIVALTNTGSRDGTATLTVASRSGALADPLLGAVRVSAGLITGVQQCTPQTVPSAPVTGTLASDVTLKDFPVGAGMTVLVCVQTSLAPDALSTHAGRQINLSITSSLRYAAGERWTTTAGPLSVTQNVEKDRFAGVKPLDSKYVGHGANFTVDWKKSGAEAGAQYRLYLARENAPHDPVRFKPGGKDQISETSIRFGRHDFRDELRAYVGSGPNRFGNTRLYIEKSSDGGATWTVFTYARIELSGSSNDVIAKGR